MRQPTGIVHVLLMLQALVLLDRRRVHQVHPIARFHQAVDQPIPVVGGLDGNALDLLAVGTKRLANPLQIVRQAPLQHHSIRLVQNHQHAIVGMKVNCSVQFHFGSSSAVVSP
ncbi:MAG: hypothetical protein CAPSK01_001131 [Candidatus Accumulibacter vicinus]|uniref:Uncharacterized protein n=1 Tax=Candidatus Accumulibacter vicinus TaxID=2954382 RepID=A0A084Y2J8_9PROT|nr:MAG: hypothetical protein CAPSK01_001131 [Candidatus Accumulibacter vicinus]